MKIEIIDGKIHCYKCNQNKCLSEFYSYKNSYKRPCKECKIKYQKSFYERNINNIEIYKSKYYLKNKEYIIRKQSIRDKLRAFDVKRYQANYRKINKIKLSSKKKAYCKIRISKDPSLKLRLYISNAIYQALKFNHSKKNKLSCLKYMSFTIQQLKCNIQNKFEPWMTWKNWGIYNHMSWNDNDSSTWTWQLDHIIPQSDFPYTSMSEDNFKKCWSLDNLRPYSAKQNVIDGNRKNKTTIYT